MHHFEGDKNIDFILEGGKELCKPNLRRSNSSLVKCFEDTFFTTLVLTDLLLIKCSIVRTCKINNTCNQNQRNLKS